MVPTSKAFWHCRLVGRQALVIMENRVLVAYASRMGSTTTIAEVISAELRASHPDGDVLPCSADLMPDG
jgi:hypothetical protein